MENNYQLSRIHNYVHGLMNREEMHALEREALDDPFLQDAIDGYRLQNGVDAKQLSLLQQRLASRVEEQSDTRKRQFYSWQRLAIGMAAGVMFLTVCTLVLMRYLTTQKTTTLTEVEIMQDQTFSLSLSNYDEDRPPVGGWKWFEGMLNQEIAPELDSNATVSVRAINHINQNDGKDVIEIQLNENRGFDDHKLIEFLKDKHWLPGETTFTIKAEKLNIK